MKWEFVEKLGSIGSLLAAAACPACFPLLAVVGATVGLGVLRPFEGVVFLVFRVLVGIAFIGNILTYFNHRQILPLILGVLSPLLIFFTFYVYWNTFVLYAGLFGLLITSVLNSVANRKCKTCQVGGKEKCN